MSLSSTGRIRESCRVVVAAAAAVVAAAAVDAVVVVAFHWDCCRMCPSC